MSARRAARPPLGRIAIAGSLAQRPARGGHTWVFLQYLLGFRRLGYEVLFLDRLEPDMCRDADGRPIPVTGSPHLRYFREVMEEFGLDDHCLLQIDGEEGSVGWSRKRAARFIADCDLLIDFMGFFADDPLLDRASRTVYFDLDPGFPQMWHDQGLAELPATYDAYVTVGGNVGRPGCSIPTCGRHWIPTFQPVVLEHWEDSSRAPAGSAFTSVGTWRGDWAPVERDGRTYGLRVHEFRKFIDLPRATALPFQIALDIHAGDAADLRGLEEGGWSLVDPIEVAGDPRAYREYIRCSRAEFLVAKNMYVQTSSGWFSDRSICYLAAGRPVLAQDTGLQGLCPLGEGLLAYSTFEEAAAGAHRIATDPDGHAAAARALAREYFDSDRVLTALLSRLDSRDRGRTGMPRERATAVAEAGGGNG